MSDLQSGAQKVKFVTDADAAHLEAEIERLQRANDTLHLNLQVAGRESSVEPTTNATPGAALLAEDSHGQVASLQGSGGCSEQPQSPSDTLAQFLNNALPKWSPLWAEYRALVGHPPVAPQRGTLEPPGEKHGEGADTGVEVEPHGVIYDKLGWLCSQCGGWNHARDAHCTHTHPRLPEKSTAPRSRLEEWNAEVDAAKASGGEMPNDPL